MKPAAPLPPAATLAAWRRLAARAVRAAGTPCFVFSGPAQDAQARALARPFRGLPVTPWWSCKTLPLGPAVRRWAAAGGPVEVVSAGELLAARAHGLSPARILVNGPAKHAWLPPLAAPGMRVNFDSAAELAALLPAARRLGWETGLRLNTSLEPHPARDAARTQFGLLAAELPAAVARLRAAGLEPRVLHFHLRTNVPEAGWYGRAAREALAAAGAAGWRPAVLDLGGGFPPARILDPEGRPLDADFRAAEVAAALRGLRHEFPFLREFWFENGRALVAPAAVLALRVLDVKEGRGVRIAICDGGRTQHALLATWERHALAPLVAAGARTRPTLVTGPTCMAFDHLGVHALPAGLRAGDVLLWFEAGAYQVCWETRFSHGLAAVAWWDGQRLSLVRRAETAPDWAAAPLAR